MTRAVAETTHVDDEEIVLGVDTHTDTHVAAVVTALGRLVATESFPTTAAGYTALLTWARGHGRLRRAGVEGTSSHGVALNRYLHGQEIQVLEVNRPNRAARRRRGKSDAVDAENAARAVLAGQATAIAKTGDGAVEVIRLFKMAKDSAIKARTQTMNQLKAVLTRTDPSLRDSLKELGQAALLRTCAALQPRLPWRDRGRGHHHPAHPGRADPHAHRGDPHPRERPDPDHHRLRPTAARTARSRPGHRCLSPYHRR